MQATEGMTITCSLDLAAGRIAQYGAGGAEYFLTDTLGSVRQLVDESGEVTLAKSYQPYGELLDSAGSTRIAMRDGKEIRESFMSILISRLWLLLLAIYAVWQGWRMITKPPAIYWHDRIVLELVKRIKGFEAAKELEIRYLEPGRIKMIGILNLVSGALIIFAGFLGLLCGSFGQ